MSRTFYMEYQHNKVTFKICHISLPYYTKTKKLGILKDFKLSTWNHVKGDLNEFLLISGDLDGDFF